MKIDLQSIITALISGWVIKSSLSMFKKGVDMNLNFEKDLGKYAKLDVGVKGGEIVASVSVPLVALLDEAAAKAKIAIPGQIDDVMIDLFMVALKAELSK